MSLVTSPPISAEQLALETATYVREVKPGFTNPAEPPKEPKPKLYTFPHPELESVA